jgi:hypothetical protein
MKEKLINGNLKVEEYSFHEFLATFQQAVLEGYRLDLETNDNFPVKYGDFLSVVLVPQTNVVLTNTEIVADASKPIPLEPPKVKAKAKAA